MGRKIAREYVLVPLASRGSEVESIYSLNPTAAFIWQRLDGRTAGRAIVEALVGEFDTDPATAGRDYLELVGTLSGLGVLKTPAEPGMDPAPV